MQAAWARREITPLRVSPDGGIHMGGYWGRRSGATGVHDPLWARTVVFRQAGRGCVLVSLDLIGVTAEWVAEARQRLATLLPFVAPDAVMICCTHTHAGPLSLPFRGMGDMDAGYLALVSDAVAESARAAGARLQDAELSYARPSVQIGLNRRQGAAGATVIGQNPQGPVAPWAHVLHLQTAAGRAVLFQHACHPVVLGNTNHEISADFAGAACAYVEAETGAFAMYINGAAGDINPSSTGATFEQMQAIGRTLGTAVADTVGSATRLGDDTIAWGRRRLELPLQPPVGVARAALEVFWQSLNVARGLAGTTWRQRVPRARLAWAWDSLTVALAPEPPRTQPFEIQAIRTGGLTWLGMEGEMFVRYQLDLEQLGGQPGPVVLCGFANGCIGYVPTEDAFDRGGYEVDRAYQVYPAVLMITPGSDDLIRTEASQLLASLNSLPSER